jgi:hypothetical protein
MREGRKNSGTGLQLSVFHILELGSLGFVRKNKHLANEICKDKHVT